VNVRVCRRGHTIDAANSYRMLRHGRYYAYCRRCWLDRARTYTRTRPVGKCGYCGIATPNLQEGLCVDCRYVRSYVRRLDRMEATERRRAEAA